MSEHRNEGPFIEFAAGATILDGRTPADAIFIIERGSVAVERRVGAALDVGERHAGEFFGETSLLQPAQGSHVIARSAVRALRIGVNDLPAVLQNDPSIAMQLLRQLSQRLQALSDPAPATPGPFDTLPATFHRAEPDAGATPLPRSAIAPAAGAFVLDHAEGRIVLPDVAGECVVGRPDPVTGAIPEIDLGPLDLARSLSRRHARLLLDGQGGIALREEPGVSNGTWVNGEKLAPGRIVTLNHGDTLRFGAIEVELGRL